METQRNILQNQRPNQALQSGRRRFAPPNGPLWARLVLAFRPLFSFKFWAIIIGAFIVAAALFGFFWSASFVGGTISGLIEGASSAPAAPVVHVPIETGSSLIDLAVATAVVGAVTIIVWRR